jgi:CDP-diacylglycerol--glycerol-3-phosphate 3-phosphatidyltransferase
MGGSNAGTSKSRLFLVQAVTLGRIPLAIAFAAALLGMDKSPAAFTVGTLLLAAVELSDFLDGILARRLNAVSQWGALLDPYADSISRIIIYWALACEGFALAIVPMGMAFRDITVAYCRIVMTWRNRAVQSNWSGKIKAWVQGTGAFLLLLGPSCLGPVTSPVSWVVFVATLASAIEYVVAACSVGQRSSP